MYLSKIVLSAKKKTLLALGNPNLIHAAIEDADREHDGTDKERSRKLWRIDRMGNRRILLILSDHSMDLSSVAEQFGDGEYQVTKMNAFLDTIKQGEQYRFRLTANPSYSTTVHDCDSETGLPVSKKRLSHCTSMQKLQWILDRAKSNGFEIDTKTLDIVQDKFQQFYKSEGTAEDTNGKQRVSFAQTTFDGCLTVTDIEKFKKVLTKGLGHEKAYGCGMMSVIPVKVAC